MLTCSICTNQFAKKQQNCCDFSCLIGHPSRTLKDIITENIVGNDGQEFVVPANSEICTKCFRKFVKFYKILQMAQQLKLELLKKLERLCSSKDQPALAKHKDLTATETMQQFEMKTFEHADLAPTEFISTMPAEAHSETWSESVHFSDDNAANLEIRKPKNKQTVADADSTHSSANMLAINAAETETTPTSQNLNETENVAKQQTVFKSTKTKLRFKEQKCLQCNEILKTRRQFLSHMNKMHSSGYVFGVCEQCGKTLFSYTGFRNHMLTHNSKTSYECNVCGIQYAHKESLKNHMACHGDEMPFHCDICSKRFPHKVSYSKHMAIHDSNYRKHACPHCASKFSSKHHLDRHLNTHSGIKPFSCPICGKCFTNKHNQALHIKEHSQPGSTKKRRYQCRVCKRTFSNADKHKSHCKAASCVTPEKCPATVT